MKNLKLPKKDFDFLCDYMELSSKKIISYIFESESNTVIFQVDDYSDFQDMMNFDIINDGMDNQDTVNKLGMQMYRIYDIILTQK